MACCLLCFDDSPVPEDPRFGKRGILFYIYIFFSQRFYIKWIYLYFNNLDKFDVSMMDTCCTPRCLAAYLCSPCCAVLFLKKNDSI